jgi:hypothetical protein
MHSHRYSCRRIQSSRISWSSRSTKRYTHYTDQCLRPQQNSRRRNRYSNCMSRIPAGPRQDNRMPLHRCSSGPRRCRKRPDIHSGNRFRLQYLCSFPRRCRTDIPHRSLFRWRMAYFRMYSCCRSHPRRRQRYQDKSGSYK